jgi:hypothetical protein
MTKFDPRLIITGGGVMTLGNLPVLAKRNRESLSHSIILQKSLDTIQEYFE